MLFLSAAPLPCCPRKYRRGSDRRLARLLLGWLATGGLDALVGCLLYQRGLPALSVFHTGPGTAAGILGVTLAVSLAAASLPARRAAHIEPLNTPRST